jgi:hypothetical protein
MKPGFSEFDIIHKAIHQTYQMLTHNENVKQTTFNELKAAHEQYLEALAHKTLIDKQYLQFMIE